MGPDYDQRWSITARLRQGVWWPRSRRRTFGPILNAAGPTGNAIMRRSLRAWLLLSRHRLHRSRTRASAAGAATLGQGIPRTAANHAAPAQSSASREAGRCGHYRRRLKATGHVTELDRRVSGASEPTRLRLRDLLGVWASGGARRSPDAAAGDGIAPFIDKYGKAVRTPPCSTKSRIRATSFATPSLPQTNHHGQVFPTPLGTRRGGVMART